MARQKNWDWARKCPGRPLEERFWEKVQFGGPDDCWPWQAGLRDDGYGQFTIAVNVKAGAHRLAWELTNQACILPGFLIRHFVCDNPVCCNPRHMLLGTPADNMRDRDQKGRHRALSGEQCRQSKLTRRKVETLRAFHKAGIFKPQELAEIYGLQPMSAYPILNRKTWK